ncbi:ATP-grasp domain-containing protein [bacterium]|nr:ATP-grasp domain-containing protein [bacterium]
MNELNVVVFQNVAHFRIDWLNLKKDFKGQLFLVTRIPETIEDDQKKAFDEIIVVDNFDEKMLEQALKKLNLKFDKFVSHDEYSIAIVSRLREKFNLKGDSQDIILPFTHKVTMKSMLADFSVIDKDFVAIKQYLKKNQKNILDEVIENLKFPIFVKPADESGSVGAKKVVCKDEFEEWLKSIPEQKDYIVEEFVEGDLFHCDIIIENYKPTVYLSCQYAYPCHESFEGKVRGSILLPENQSVAKRLTEFSSKILEKIKLPEASVLHLEAFLLKDGSFKFVELAMRPPGSIIPYMYESVLGVNIEELYYRLQIGLSYKYSESRMQNAAWISYPQKNGKFVSKRKIDQGTVKRIIWKKEEGDTLSNPDPRYPVCQIILSGLDYEQLEKDFNYLTRDFYPAEVKK